MKTIEEKAIEYADRPTTAKTWGMHKRALIDAYLAGATEALTSQWRNVEDELPPNADNVLVHIDFSDAKRNMDNFGAEAWESAMSHTVAYYRDECWNFLDEYYCDCNVDRWMPIPKLTNPESK